MKLIFFGDRHNSETVPGNRIDDFMANTRLKDEEIKRLGVTHNASAFLHPGDFLERNRISNQKAQELVTFWTGKESVLEDIITSGTSKKVANDFTPVIGVFGNHDLIGADYETRDNTILGLLANLGVFNMVTKENPYILHTEYGKTVAITGTSYHTGMDRDKYVDDYIVDEKLGDFHIHIVHGMLTDKSVGSLYRHTTIDQVKHTKADLTLVGHDHLGFGVIRHEGKIFANTGAIVRQKNDKKELARIPKVLLITIDEKGLDVEEIELKSAKPGKDVLSRKMIDQALGEKNLIQDFKEKTESLNLLKSVDIKDILKEISEHDKIDDSLKNGLISKIQEKEALDHTVISVPEDFHILKVILENFQIHKYTELDLSKGLNILIGESRQGKSAILRGIRWVLEDKVPGKAKSFIRNGSDFSRVSLVLSNGIVVERYIEAKRSGKNTFKITYPNGDIQEGNTRLLEEVQRVLGFTDFKIDKDLSVPINILRQGSSWFLIGDNYTSIDRAKIIGALSGTHYADAVKRDLDGERRKLSTDIKSQNKDIANIEKQLLNYTHLEALSKTINRVEEELLLLSKKQEDLEKIKKEFNDHCNLVKLIEQQKNIIKDTSSLPVVRTTFAELKSKALQMDSVSNLLNQYSLDLQRKQSAQAFIDEAKGLNNSKLRLKKLETNFSKRSQITSIDIENKKIHENLININKILTNSENLKKSQKQLFKLRQNIQSLETMSKKLHEGNVISSQITSIKESIDTSNEILKSSKDLKTFKERFNQSYLKNIQKNKIEQLAIERNKLQVFLQIEDKKVKDSRQKVNTSLKRYKDLLEEAGFCPICQGTLDKAVVNQLIANLTNNKEDHYEKRRISSPNGRG